MTIKSLAEIYAEQVTGCFTHYDHLRTFDPDFSEADFQEAFSRDIEFYTNDFRWKRDLELQTEGMTQEESTAYLLEYIETRRAERAAPALAA